MERVTCPIFICLNIRNRYQEPCGESAESPFWGGDIQGIRIENVCAHGVEVPSLIFGFETEGTNGEKIRKPVKDITICHFEAVYQDNEEILEIPETVEEFLYEYPENNLVGDVDACGLWVRHCDGLVLEDIRVVPRSINRREKIRLYDVILTSERARDFN